MSSDEAPPEPQETAADQLTDELARKYDPERLLKIIGKRAGKGQSLDVSVRNRYERKFGVDLGLKTWTSFLSRVGLAPDQIDKVICHQVGKGHREQVLQALGIAADRDFCTYPYLGNIGTVSLPITAAIADERGFLLKGDRVALLGIGSGLNCLMLAVDW